MGAGFSREELCGPSSLRSRTPPPVVLDEPVNRELLALKAKLIALEAENERLKAGPCICCLPPAPPKMEDDPRPVALPSSLVGGEGAIGSAAVVAKAIARYNLPPPDPRAGKDSLLGVYETVHEDGSLSKFLLSQKVARPSHTATHEHGRALHTADVALHAAKRSPCAPAAPVDRRHTLGSWHREDAARGAWPARWYRAA